jgi:hypothetical protein
MIAWNEFKRLLWFMQYMFISCVEFIIIAIIFAIIEEGHNVR